jgi:hypothetical protein
MDQEPLPPEPPKPTTQILDLPTEMLMEIFDNLPEEDRMNTMAACKRFEETIGNSKELYRDFHLTITPSSLTKDPETLLKIRRRIGSITIKDFHAVRSEWIPKKTPESLFQKVLKFFRRVGSSVLRLKIYECSMREDYFVELMSLVQNCETVILNSVTFVSSKEIPKVDIKFQRLHKLSLDGVKNCAILDAVFTTKSIRKLTIRYNSTDWSTFEKIMLRQKYLKSLKVWYNRIEGFKNSPEKWKSIQVEKLLVLDNRFGNKEDFESICAFLKTQKKVQNLQIEGFEGYDNENLLKETILGLLHLDTLRLLGSCPIEPSWRIHNPNVTTSLNEMGFLGFPNLTMLKYHRPLTPEILSQINSLQRLTVLNINSATPQLLELMKIKELKKLHFFLGIKGAWTYTY